MAPVVDTDVASFLFKKDTRSALYAPHLDGHMLIISLSDACRVGVVGVVGRVGSAAEAAA
jgi:hypothetical protein